MSLQRRLTIIFIAIVILPLAAAGLIVHRLVVGEVEGRAERSLTPALDSATLVFNDRIEVIDESVRAAVSDPRFGRLLERRDAQGVQGFLSERVASYERIDFLIGLDSDGEILGSIRRPPEFTPGFEPVSDELIAGGLPGPGLGFVTTGRIQVRAGQRRVGWVVGGFWLDRAFLADPQGEVELSIAAGDALIASTARVDSGTDIALRTGEEFDADIGGASKAVARRIGAGLSLIASTPTAPIRALSSRVLISVLVVLVLATSGTIALAYALARFITRPLEELAVGAREISEGHFDHRIPVRSRDEVGQLAVLFNEMTERLRETIGQLSLSRDQLQKAVRRVGDTLQATHDMKQLLESILRTTVEAAGADSGVLWRFTPTREELYAARLTGSLPKAPERLIVGEGIVGFAAEHGRTVMLPSGDAAPASALGEPSFPVTIAVPLYSQSRVLGVVSLYRRDRSHPFNDKDLDTVVLLAEQAGVAIENVLLHEEAQRLSLTDGLTGVWNRRYFQMQFRSAVAASARFGRTFTILMMDLDHFKQVNDTYGHQRGDEILIEFSRRVNSILREVDTLARYGGEEFIALLSETNVDGGLIVAEKILHGVRTRPFGAADEALPITVSVGVACFPEHGHDFRTLVAAADRALYIAKDQGRDRVRLPDDLEGVLEKG